MIVLRSQTGYESLWASIAHITGMSLGEAGAILGGGRSDRETTLWTAQIEFFFMKNAFLGPTTPNKVLWEASGLYVSINWCKWPAEWVKVQYGEIRTP